MENHIVIEPPDGTFRAYISRPSKLPAPAVVVLQEVFGVNADIRATCDELATHGFIAVAPDLFWRQEPGVDLSHWTEAEWKKGLALYEAYDLDRGVEDVAATIAAAKALGADKVGVMGFCLGGLMTFLTAARAKPDAAVAYYGGRTEAYINEASAIDEPMMLHLGEEDEFISKEAQRQIKSSFAAKSQVKIYSYPGCSHAFARHTGTRYDASAAKIANRRTIEFFSEHLNS